MTQPIHPPVHPGYVSEEARRRFGIVAGLLGVGFFVLQMVIPVVAMFAVMASSMGGDVMAMQLSSVSGAALFDQRLHYLVGEMSPRTASRNHLVRIDETGQPKRVAGVDAPDGTVFLLPDGDRLFLVSGEKTVVVQGGGQSTIVSNQCLGSISPPFLYEGHPAVFVESPSGIRLHVLKNGSWEPGANLLLAKSASIESITHDVQVVARGDRLDTFVRLGGTIYHYQGLPLASEGDDVTSRSPWHPVAPASRLWRALESGGELAVVRMGREEHAATGPVTALRQKDDRWEPFFEKHFSMVSDLGAVNLAPGRIEIALQGMPGSVRLLTIADGRMLGERKVGSGFMFGRQFMVMFTLIQAGTLVAPLLLAIVLSGLMRQSRIGRYSAGATTAEFASLTRRAFAQLFDAAIELGPLALSFTRIFSVFEDFESPTDFLKILAGFGAGFSWFAACFFVFAFLQGRYGWTPGKWICAIRVVGTDLRPCGFGRSALRELLKFADGFYNFMVGIMVSAFSENWQRVGDMAARTVVVRARGTYARA